MGLITKFKNIKDKFKKCLSKFKKKELSLSICAASIKKSILCMLGGYVTGFLIEILREKYKPNQKISLSGLGAGITVLSMFLPPTYAILSNIVASILCWGQIKEKYKDFFNSISRILSYSAMISNIGAINSAPLINRAYNVIFEGASLTDYSIFAIFTFIGGLCYILTTLSKEQKVNIETVPIKTETNKAENTNFEKENKADQCEKDLKFLREWRPVCSEPSYEDYKVLDKLQEDLKEKLKELPIIKIEAGNKKEIPIKRGKLIINFKDVNPSIEINTESRSIGIFKGPVLSIVEAKTPANLEDYLVSSPSNYNNVNVENFVRTFLKEKNCEILIIQNGKICYIFKKTRNSH